MHFIVALRTVHLVGLPDDGRRDQTYLFLRKVKPEMFPVAGIW